MPSIPASTEPPVAPVVLSVQDLQVSFAGEGGFVPVGNEVSFTVRAAETVALVGESGSGKSVTSLALMRLLPPAPRTRVGGSVRFLRRDGRRDDLLALPEDAMRGLRGNEI